MGIHTKRKMLKLHVFSLSHNTSVWNTWTKLISFQNSKGGHEKYGRQTIRVHLQACCSSQLQFAFSIAACKWIVQWNSACCANAAGAIFLQCAQFFSAVHPKQCNQFFFVGHPKQFSQCQGKTLHLTRHWLRLIWLKTSGNVDAFPIIYGCKTKFLFSPLDESYMLPTGNYFWCLISYLADCPAMSFVLRNPNMNKLSWTINYIISYISLNDMISDTFFLWVFSENLEHAFALMPSRVAIFGRAVILN